LSRSGTSEAVGQPGFDEGKKDIRPVVHPAEKDDQTEERPGKQQGRQGQPFLSASATDHSGILTQFAQDETRDFDRQLAILTEINERLW
jgi:hypothetical protein